MKNIIWLATTHDVVRGYPPGVRREIGYNLDKIQRGLEEVFMKHHLTKGSAFDDLGFDAPEAHNLKIRAALMRAIEEELEKRKLTQEKAAKILGVSQPRVSDLIRGKIQLFTIDVLINMLEELGKPVSILIDDRLAA